LGRRIEIIAGLKSEGLLFLAFFVIPIRKNHVTHIYLQIAQERVEHFFPYKFDFAIDVPSLDPLQSYWNHKMMCCYYGFGHNYNDSFSLEQQWALCLKQGLGMN
jgi:hypothetical protein